MHLENKSLLDIEMENKIFYNFIEIFKCFLKQMKIEKMENAYEITRK